MRKIDGIWKVIDDIFVDNWFLKEYQEGIEYLKNLIASDGYVVGAFIKNQLKGFASVEPTFFGEAYKYLDLSNIHVSKDVRGKGIEKELFHLAMK